MPTDDRVEPRADIRALIVDFGGVLTTPLQDGMEAFARSVGLELQDLVRVALRAYTGVEDTLVSDFEMGRLAEDDFARQLAARLAAETGVVIEPRGLVHAMFSEVRLEESMFAAVQAARRAGLRTALCSNSWGEGLYPRERLTDCFDVVVISGEVGLRKPDPAIFRLTTERLEVEAPRCVFVDDHPGHLQVAAAAGMKTVLHTTPSNTIKELESLLGLELGAGAEDAQR